MIWMKIVVLPPLINDGTGVTAGVTAGVTGKKELRFIIKIFSSCYPDLRLTSQNCQLMKFSLIMCT